MDKIDLDEIGMKEQIRAEIDRHKKFQSGLLGIKEKAVKVGDVDVRNYAKYILRDGTMFEKARMTDLPAEQDYDGGKGNKDCLKKIRRKWRIFFSLDLTGGSSS